MLLYVYILAQCQRCAWAYAIEFPGSVKVGHYRRAGWSEPKTVASLSFITRQDHYNHGQRCHCHLLCPLFVFLVTLAIVDGFIGHCYDSINKDGNQDVQAGVYRHLNNALYRRLDRPRTWAYRCGIWYRRQLSQAPMSSFKNI